MKVNFVREGYQTTTLCIDGYEQKNPQGRFYNQAVPEGAEFSSVTWLLIKMENSLDKLQAPKSFNDPRSFTLTPLPENKTGPPGHFRAGEVATFTIRVLFRQHSSWQGSITWIEGKREQSFRSVLELILLIDSAIGIEQAS